MVGLPTRTKKVPVDIESLLLKSTAYLWAVAKSPHEWKEQHPYPYNSETSWPDFREGKTYRVLVVLNGNWIDYKHRNEDTFGVILKIDGYPFVWDADRFDFFQYVMNTEPDSEVQYIPKCGCDVCKGHYLGDHHDDGRGEF